MSNTTLPQGEASPIPDSIPTRMGIIGTHNDGLLRFGVNAIPPILTHGALRATAFVCLVDIVAGITVDTDPDLWIFTSDLSVRVPAVTAPPVVHGTAEVVRAGRRSSTVAVPLTLADGSDFGLGIATFSRVARREGDPVKPTIDFENLTERWKDVVPIDVPLTEVTGLRVLRPEIGEVQLEIHPDVSNPSGALHGAMVGLVAEAAAEQLATAALGSPQIVTGLDLRYLKQARIGPVRSRARHIGPPSAGTIAVDLYDTGLDNALLTTVTARTEPAPPAG